MVDIVIIIGLVAATLTTIAFIPQVIKTWRMKETRDISELRLVLFSVGILLWLIYGLFISNIPLIVANTATLALGAIMLFFKFKYK